MNESTTLLEHASSIQALIINGHPTPFMSDINKVIYQTSKDAEASDPLNDQTTPMYIIPAPTGSGKTTFTVALIAANFLNTPDYSAVIVTHTIQEAQSLFNMFEKVVPVESIYIHTSAHKSHNISMTRYEYGDVVADHVIKHGTSSISGLSNHRIVICTHAHWLKEGQIDQDLGVRNFKNNTRRTHVFIDELPDFLSAQETVPSDLAFFQEQLNRLSDLSAEKSIAETVHTRMLDLCSSARRKYDVANIISTEEYSSLQSIEWSTIEHEADFPKISKILAFLKNASLQKCYITRGQNVGEIVNKASDRICFISYKLDLNDCAGTILLDASAKLSAFANLHPNVELIATPTINYSNLSITHIESPSEFRNIANNVTTLQTDKEYIGWIKNTITEHSKSGEHILVVLHKRHLKLVASHEGSQQYRGRTLHYCNWGTGIGSNQWKDCSSVFLFSEFHLPRRAYLSETLALSGEEVTRELLNSVIGQCMTKATKKVSEGHRLRWLLQMASRGNVRNADAHGVCGEMKLFTTMDRNLLLSQYQTLFPNTSEPSNVLNTEIRKKSRPVQLVEYFLNSGKVRIEATDIASAFDWKNKDVSKAFQSSTCRQLTSIGWECIQGNGKASKPYFIKKEIRTIFDRRYV